MSTVIIAAIPDFVSADEHRNIVASTPPSFSEIPSILRHKEDNVTITFDPPLDGFTAQDGASGALYIIESALVFMSSTGRGFQIKYPAITLHAISRAEGGPSIYCQLDESDALSDQDVPDMRELTILPQNADSLESIFEAMSLCASLHPDPDLSDEDGLDGDFVSEDHFDTLAEDGEELSEVGRAALAHLESIIHDPFDSQTNLNGDVDGTEDASSEQEEETKE